MYLMLSFYNTHAWNHPVLQCEGLWRDCIIRLFSGPFHCGDGICSSQVRIRASLVVQVVKSPPAMQETCVLSLGQEDPLEKEMATHFSITIPKKGNAKEC